MRKHYVLLGLIILFSIGLLLNAHFNGPQFKKEEYLKIKESDTSDDLWAKAIWITLPGHDFESEEAEKLLMEALKKTKYKPQIYVALGDLGGSIFSLKEEIDHSVENALIKKPEELLNDIDQFMEEGKGSAILYYSAAVTEDPNYIFGWFKLAKHAEDKAQLKAINKLIELDPQNALPYYMMAAYYSGKKDFEMVGVFIEKGNQQPKCHFYETEMPKNYTLYFHDDELYREMNLVGKKISPVFFENIVQLMEDSQSWADPLRPSLRYIAFDLEEQLKNNNGVNNTEFYISQLKHIEVMGEITLVSTPRRLSYILLAISQIRYSSTILKEFYEEKGMEKEAKEHDLKKTQLLNRLKGLKKIIDELQALQDKKTEFFNGELDLKKMEEDKIENLLIKKGYLKPENVKATK